MWVKGKFGVMVGKGEGWRKRRKFMVDRGDKEGSKRKGNFLSNSRNCSQTGKTGKEKKRDIWNPK